LACGRYWLRRPPCFSAGRALQDLSMVAAVPHPIGSPRNAAVSYYLVAQIEAMGLAPELHSATLTRARPERGMATITAVENILVRVPGTASRSANVAAGHNDSVPTGSGAADRDMLLDTRLGWRRTNDLRLASHFLLSGGTRRKRAGAKPGRPKAHGHLAERRQSPCPGAGATVPPAARNGGRDTRARSTCRYRSCPRY
jgi:hypothetical protein